MIVLTLSLKVESDAKKKHINAKFILKLSWWISQGSNDEIDLKLLDADMIRLWCYDIDIIHFNSLKKGGHY